MLTVAPTVLAARLPYARVTTAVLVVVFAVLTGLSAQWAIYLPGNPVPITGQTLVVLLGGAALGVRAGVTSSVLYLAMGAAGLPFFAGGESGYDTFTAPSAGYLVGFVAATALVGRLAERKADRSFSTMVVAFLGGSAVIYLFGVAGLLLTTDMDLVAAVSNGVYPFVIGDLIKAGAAGVLTPTAWKLTKTR